jgi:hypothetical protein
MRKHLILFTIFLITNTGLIATKLEPKHKIHASPKSEASVLKKCLSLCYNRDKLKLKINYLTKLLDLEVLTTASKEKHKSQIEITKLQLKYVEQDITCQCNHVLDNLSFLKEDR